MFREDNSVEISIKSTQLSYPKELPPIDIQTIQISTKASVLDNNSEYRVMILTTQITDKTISSYSEQVL